MWRVSCLGVLILFGCGGDREAIGAAPLDAAQAVDVAPGRVVAGGDALIGSAAQDRGTPAAPDAGATDAAPAAPGASFRAASCSGLSLAYPIRCGVIEVPEARSGAPTARRVSLAVLIVKSTSPTPAPDPLVYLEGGPGGSSIDTVAALGARAGGPLATFLARRDVIAIDQRGTGRSAPRLDCPELADQPMMGMLPPMMMPAMPVELVQRCHDRLAALADLAQYNTAAAADDVADAREALGYAQWNVMGASYGTRLALEVMRRHAEGLRSVILDSVWPAQVDIIAEGGPNFVRSLDLVFDACAAQPACNRAYPQARETFLDVVRRLNAHPVALSMGGAATLTGDLFASVVVHLLYVATVIPAIPELIFQVRDGNYAALAKLASSTSSDDASIALGLHFSVMCADALPFTSAGAVQAAAAAVPHDLQDALTARLYLDVCPAWRVPASPRAFVAPVTAPLRTLVLSGQFDPVTPPAWGQLAATGLPMSQFLEVKAQSHGVFVSGCGAALVSDFLDNPAQRPAPACLAGLSDLKFSVLR